MKHTRVLLGFLMMAVTTMFLFCGDNVVQTPGNSGKGGDGGGGGDNTTRPVVDVTYSNVAYYGEDGYATINFTAKGKAYFKTTAVGASVAQPAKTDLKNWTPLDNVSGPTTRNIPAGATAFGEDRIAWIVVDGTTGISVPTAITLRNLKNVSYLAYTVVASTDGKQFVAKSAAGLSKSTAGNLNFTGNITAALDAIRKDASGSSVRIAFGSSSAPLNIGTTTLLFENPTSPTSTNPQWGNPVTLTGFVNGNNPGAVLSIRTGTVLVDGLTVENTALGGIAVSVEGTAVVTITGSDIKANTTNGKALVNTSSTKVSVTGGQLIGKTSSEGNVYVSPTTNAPGDVEEDEHNEILIKTLVWFSIEEGSGFIFKSDGFFDVVNVTENLDGDLERTDSRNVGTWKTENRQLVLTIAREIYRFRYSLNGDVLTLVDDDAKTTLYLTLTDVDAFIGDPNPPVLTAWTSPSGDQIVVDSGAGHYGDVTGSRPYALVKLNSTKPGTIRYAFSAWSSHSQAEFKGLSTFPLNVSTGGLVQEGLSLVRLDHWNEEGFGFLHFAAVGENGVLSNVVSLAVPTGYYRKDNDVTKSAGYMSSVTSTSFTGRINSKVNGTLRVYESTETATLAEPRVFSAVDATSGKDTTFTVNIANSNRPTDIVLNVFDDDGWGTWGPSVPYEAVKQFGNLTSTDLAGDRPEVEVGSISFSYPNAGTAYYRVQLGAPTTTQIEETEYAGGTVVNVGGATTISNIDLTGEASTSQPTFWVWVVETDQTYLPTKTTPVSARFARYDETAPEIRDMTVVERDTNDDGNNIVKILFQSTGIGILYFVINPTTVPNDNVSVKGNADTTVDVSSGENTIEVVVPDENAVNLYYVPTKNAVVADANLGVLGSKTNVAAVVAPVISEARAVKTEDGDLEVKVVLSASSLAKTILSYELVADQNVSSSTFSDVENVTIPPNETVGTFKLDVTEVGNNEFIYVKAVNFVGPSNEKGTDVVDYDITAPELSAGLLKEVYVGEKVKFAFTSSEAGRVYYRFSTTPVTAPGKDAPTTGWNLVTTGVKTTNDMSSGLETLTHEEGALYVFVEDAAGNRSSALSILISVPPVFTALTASAVWTEGSSPGDDDEFLVELVSPAPSSGVTTAYFIVVSGTDPDLTTIDGIVTAQGVSYTVVTGITEILNSDDGTYSQKPDKVYLVLKYTADGVDYYRIVSDVTIRVG